MIVVIGVADCHVTGDPSNVLVTYALGSCVGVSIYDPVARMGGLLHFMLPDSAAGTRRRRARVRICSPTAAFR